MCSRPSGTGCDGIAVISLVGCKVSRRGAETQRGRASRTRSLTRYMLEEALRGTIGTITPPRLCVSARNLAADERNAGYAVTASPRRPRAPYLDIWGQYIYWSAESRRGCCNRYTVPDFPGLDLRQHRLRRGALDRRLLLARKFQHGRPLAEDRAGVNTWRGGGHFVIPAKPAV